ncbi:hypothetical protein CHELA40_13924 [Chelatococcus asaccharovorans]|nr:hypothetical protein CHELA40_13924 [Chelatococcus asaccharovorans]CAH1674690.1 hypothetical protein CHELA17_61704 [Chelatococcus asaccharovorans]
MKGACLYCVYNTDTMSHIQDNAEGSSLALFLRPGATAFCMARSVAGRNVGAGTWFWRLAQNRR